jgi:serine/threonine protein kinase
MGKGTFGEVRKAIDVDSGRLVAVKKIPLPPKGTLRWDMMWREVKVLSSCFHVHT